ncbi:MAG: (2Fe-2S)-binding protein [Candidatus Marinimicrobia bacterium]|nr:(2Fe-2S)-binding protein [Candidatus Neomarinimicrobiota bacterium]
MAKTQDYGLGEFTFPRGWFMVADAAELKDKPLAVRFFGEDLVIYRGKSGRVVMLEAYCAHMGAHLAKNSTSYVVHDGTQIEGDSIRCPFHAWRYGPDGKCNDIPYSEGAIPKAACIKKWIVEERMGVIFAWHDAEGSEPDYNAPFLKEWNDPAWVHWKIDHLGELSTHPQEIVDNMVDVAHMAPTHGSKDIAYFENEFKDHIVVQRFGSGHRTLVSDSGALLETDTWYTGPGVLLSLMKGEYPSIILITHTPIDDGIVKVWHALLVKSPNKIATPNDVENARTYQESSRMAFAQDFEIWGNKRPCLKPLQIPADGPFHKLRTWYKQFYNPRSRSPEFTEKVNGVHTVVKNNSESKAVA